MLQHLILVIDDEEPVRGAVTDILELEGLAVLSAPDGQTGIDLYRARQADIDLIMLDLSMPGLTGEETFRELRQINPQVRIMLSSGYSHDEVISRFAGQHEVAFIQKPYDASQLSDRSEAPVSTAAGLSRAGHSGRLYLWLPKFLLESMPRGCTSIVPLTWR